MLVISATAPHRSIAAASQSVAQNDRWGPNLSHSLTDRRRTWHVQNFFRGYKKLAGMTGTALTESSEFSYTYTLNVAAVPTNRVWSAAHTPAHPCSLIHACPAACPLATMHTPFGYRGQVAVLAPKMPC